MTLIKRYYNRKIAAALNSSAGELWLRSLYAPHLSAIYITNPKVGGSSIIQTLIQNDTGVTDHARKNHNEKASREQFSSTRNPRGFWADLNDPSVYKFSFVRNPYSRALSCYRDKIVNEPNDRFREMLGFDGDATISFEDFLKALRTEDMRKTNRHWRTQSLLLPKGLNFTFVGRFENFSEDLAKVLGDLNLPTSEAKTERPHQTNTANTVEMSDAEKTLIQDIYSEDFIRFNYAP